MNIEYPVYGQTITLSSPINIDKNLTINGFQSMNVYVTGVNLSSSVFSIMAGKSVSINGMDITCSQGNIEGRCILNQGHLTMDNLNLQDINGGSSGNSVKNTTSGTITIKNNVTISK